MMGIMIETVVMAFVMGGIVGAVTALQLRSEQKPELVRIKQRDPRYHHRR